MKKHPWFKLWPTVWLSDPHLNQCKWDAKGLLADLMCLAHNGFPRGYLTNGGLPLSIQDIAKTFRESVRKTSRLMQLLLKLNRIGQTSDSIWFIPSMVRETEQATQAQQDGLKGGNPDLVKPLTVPLNPPVKLEAEAEADTTVEAEQSRGDSVPSGGEENGDEKKLCEMESLGIMEALSQERNASALQKKILSYPLKKIRECWRHVQKEQQRGVLRKPPLALFQVLLKSNFDDSSSHGGQEQERQRQLEGAKRIKEKLRDEEKEKHRKKNQPPPVSDEENIPF